MNDVKLCVWHLPHALGVLQQGIHAVDAPDEAVTHLLLPVPLFDTELLPLLLAALPPTVTVLGGKLQHPLLERYPRMDLLQDDRYLAENAALTAEAALRLAGNYLSVRFADLPVLVIGWGRIGKCLAQQLGRLGAAVSVAARKEADRAMIAALGYSPLSMEQMYPSLPRFHVIFNTVPAPILSQEALQACRHGCVKIDLASVRGMAGDDVIHARGLPGKLLPEAQETLIADTVLRLLGKEASS